MQNIPFSLAAPGMVLAKEVKNIENPDGPPMCGKGVALTESLISRLGKMGIQSLTVEGHPVNMEGEATAEEMLAALDKRFRKVQEDALMQKLKEIYRRHIIRSMGDENGQ